MKQSSAFWMRRWGATSLLAAVLLVTGIGTSHSQCQPYILIDGNATSPLNLPLPYWLKEGQTLGMNTSVTSISVIEFLVDGSSLQFSQVLSITTTSTVPDNHVWKIESFARLPINGAIQNTVTYSTPGTYSFTVPSCTNYICAEVWGGGAGGGGNTTTSGSGGGGGGGGYGTGCFVVTPGSSITVTVGAGGPGGFGSSSGTAGGSSSVGSLISSTGGNPGAGTTSSSASGGSGGTSTSAVSIPGGNGGNGVAGNCGTSGVGGAGGNGGAGGASVGCNSGNNGTAPGGGGSGSNSGSNRTGGNGASGQVKISW